MAGSEARSGRQRTTAASRAAPASKASRPAASIPSAPEIDPGEAALKSGDAAARDRPSDRPSAADDARNRSQGGDGFAETTSRIVRQAASILEEEIAAGVVAASQVEKRFIDVETLRSGDSDEVIQRLRRDTHEVVDILLDLAHVATRSVGGMAGRAIRLRPAMPGDAGGTSGGSPQPHGGASALPTLTLPAPVPPGGSSEATLTVENETESPTVAFEFQNTDLVDDVGNRIPADRITFSRQSMSIAAHETERIAVRINVPDGTPAGRYSGLVQASRMDHVRAILLVEIT